MNENYVLELPFLSWFGHYSALAAQRQIFLPKRQQRSNGGKTNVFIFCYLYHTANYTII